MKELTPAQIAAVESAQAAHREPDIDICRACGEHAEFDEGGSTCCGAGAYCTDVDVDMER